MSQELENEQGGVNPPEPVLNKIQKPSEIIESEISLNDIDKEKINNGEISNIEFIQKTRNSMASVIKKFKKDLQKNKNQIINKYEQSRVNEITKTIKENGISIKIGDGSNVLVDYSMLKDKLNGLNDSNKSDFENIERQLATLERTGADIRLIKDKFKSIKNNDIELLKLYEVLECFFINPPSREVLIEESNIINLEAIKQQYSELSSKLDTNAISSKIDELQKEFGEYESKYNELKESANKAVNEYKSTLEKLSTKFETFRQDEFNKLENFQNKISDRFNQTSENYNGFITEFAKQLSLQQDILKANVDNYKEIQKEHLAFISKLRGQEKGLVYINLILAVVLGGILVAMFFVIS